MTKILLTGGAGYIGSHMAIELLQTGYEVVVYDNLSNSSPHSIDRASKIVGQKIQLIEGDIRDHQQLNKIFELNNFEGVIHFAGLKAVGESVEQPLSYYNNNVYGSISLLETMTAHNVKTLVFSSSATVYDNLSPSPYNEESSTLSPSNPYGMTKLIVENILTDIYSADPTWSIAKLRYFNPVGAHPSGLIGENPSGMPNNIMPMITQTAFGIRDTFSIFGNDYPTPDGTGIRDFIHVTDLVLGHLYALKYCLKRTGLININLGTGIGHSVLELLAAFERVNKVKVPYQVVARRPGDIAECYADTTLAKKMLGWSATRDLDDMCRDSWNWQTKNPNGYMPSNRLSIL